MFLYGAENRSFGSGLRQGTRGALERRRAGKRGSIAKYKRGRSPRRTYLPLPPLPYNYVGWAS